MLVEQFLKGKLRRQGFVFGETEFREKIEELREGEIGVVGGLFHVEKVQVFGCEGRVGDIGVGD